jgi:glycoside/pentoside/hexuronide:cation symporter, GPH family
LKPVLHNFSLVYGLAHGGKTLYWAMSAMLFAFFLTEICELEPKQMGSVLAVSLVINACADIIVGRRLITVVIDAKSAARVQFGGALCSGAALLLFTLTPTVPEPWRVGYAITALLLFRVTYAYFDNPQNSLLSLASNSDSERAFLSATRQFSGGIAKIGIAASFAPLLMNQSQQVQMERFIGFTALIVAIATFSSLFLYWWLRDHLLVVAPKETVAKIPINALHARPLWSARRLFVMAFLSAVMTTTFAQLEPYVSAYVVTTNAKAAAIMTAIAIGTCFSQPFWVWLGGRMSLAQLLRCSLLVIVLGALVFWLFVRSYSLAASIAGLVYGTGVGGLYMTLWAQLAKVASASKSGETASFGVFTCLSKLGEAAAVLVVGAVLSSGAYRLTEVASALLLPVMVAAPIVGALAVTCASYFPSRLHAPAGLKQ